MNNKGFAISGIIYTILLIFLIVLAGILSLFNSRKNVLDNLKNKVECFIEQLLSDKNYLDKDKIKELIIVNDLKQEKIVDTYTIKYKLL